MSVADDITVLVLTYNEAPNIGRTLEAVSWSPRIIVVDSFSTDDTLDIVRRFPQTTTVQRKFDQHAAQWNFGLSLCPSGGWVLALDADYVVSDLLRRELHDLDPPADVDGYRVAFRYCAMGRPLRGGIYPSVIALFRRDGAQYVQEGHTQRVVLKGETADLRSRMDHDDRKPLGRWMNSQVNYARLEADYILSNPRKELRRVDRLRLMMWPMPIIAFFYTLLWRGCIWDGWPGWYYTLQRVAAEVVIALELLERRLRDH